MGKLSATSLKILEVMKNHPDGITEGEIRAILKIPPEEQANFGRRRRELSSVYEIEKRQDGARVLYLYKGLLAQKKDFAPISSKLRAQILHIAKGRCGMCGRSVEKHNITLVVDHKLPRDLGGTTDEDNLWALCEECNGGKKNYFKSVSTPAVKAAVAYESIHMRLGETLKASKGQPVPAAILQFVANQDDWKKRTRELRYLGWTITTSRKSLPGGRVSSFYTLVESKPWPEDPTGFIRKFERDRAEKNRKEEDDID